MLNFLQAQLYILNNLRLPVCEQRLDKIFNKLGIVQKEESSLFYGIALNPVSFFDQVVKLEFFLFKKGIS